MDIITMRELAKGLATYVPGLMRLRRGRTRGTDSARYCYSVWLRHLVMVFNNGLDCQPFSVAELGPGDSLGAGLAALLSGVSRYQALDTVEYASVEANLAILGELIELFAKREAIPGEIEFPDVHPRLKSYDFPRRILTEDRLKEALQPNRIEAIRDALCNLGADGEGEIQISYCVPWYEPTVIIKNSVDMAFSQAVLEHVDQLAHTYRALWAWLKPGGFMSHEIGFTSHDRAKAWNGHWAYPDIIWKLIRGKRSYLLNREPLSTHLDLMQEVGFGIICTQRAEDTSGIARRKLAHRFRGMSDEDLTTRSAYVLAAKPRDPATDKPHA